jgi:hypothetical protein
VLHQRLEEKVVHKSNEIRKKLNFELDRNFLKARCRQLGFNRLQVELWFTREATEYWSPLSLQTPLQAYCFSSGLHTAFSTEFSVLTMSVRVMEYFNCCRPTFQSTVLPPILQAPSVTFAGSYWLPIQNVLCDSIRLWILTLWSRSACK